jgi:predicted ester cyclase
MWDKGIRPCAGPGTGKTVEVSYIDMWRLEDGKAVENWVQMDLLGLMQQLGIIPAGP